MYHQAPPSGRPGPSAPTGAPPILAQRSQDSDQHYSHYHRGPPVAAAAAAPPPTVTVSRSFDHGQQKPPPPGPPPGHFSSPSRTPAAAGPPVVLRTPQRQTTAAAVAVATPSRPLTANHPPGNSSSSSMQRPSRPPRSLPRPTSRTNSPVPSTAAAAATLVTKHKFRLPPSSSRSSTAAAAATTTTTTTVGINLTRTPFSTPESTPVPSPAPRVPTIVAAVASATVALPVVPTVATVNETAANVTAAAAAAATTANGSDAATDQGPSAADALLPDWTPATDPATGKVYYCNAVTGESSWERPAAVLVKACTATTTTTMAPAIPEEHAPTGAAAVVESVADDTSPFVATAVVVALPEEEPVVLVAEATNEGVNAHENVNAPVAQDPPGALPPGWAEQEDPSSGRMYYYCAAEGLTQWELPTVDHDDAAADVDMPVQESTFVPDPLLCDEPAVEWEEEPGLEQETLPLDTVVESAGVATTKEKTPIEEFKVQTVTSEATTQVVADNIDTSTPYSLPTGWEGLIDPGSGRTYYYNAESGVTSWEMPEQADDMPQDTVESQGAIEVIKDSQDASRLVVGDMVDELVSRTVEQYDTTPVVHEESALDSAVEEWDLDEDDVIPLGQAEESISKLDEAPELALAEGWEKSTDEASGRTYYYNAIDNATSWERPISNTAAVETVFEESSLLVTIAAVKDTIPPVAEQNEQALPEGWAECIDKSSGRTFFYNAIENTTSWERPVFDEAWQSEQGVEEVAPKVEEVEIFEVAEELMGSSQPDDIDMAIGTASQATDAFESEESVLEGGEMDRAQPELSTSGESETVAQALPEGWEECIDETSGQTYYYNTSDNVTSWETPVCASVQFEQGSALSIQENVDDDAIGGVDDTGSYTADASESEGAILEGDGMAEDQPEEVFAEESETAEQVLPEGWEEYVDAFSGRPYYCNATDNVTSWERPTTDAVQPGVEDEDTPAPEEVQSPPVHAAELSPEDTSTEPGDAMVHATGAVSEEEAIIDTGDQSEQNPEDAIEEVVDDTARSPDVPSLDEHLHGWVELFDEATEKTYYFCELTDETSWERPVGSSSTTGEPGDNIVDQATEAAIDDPSKIGAPEKEGTLIYTVDSKEGEHLDPWKELDGEEDESPPEETAKGPPTALPDGWEEHIDLDSGLPYYVNTVDGSPTWDRPTEDQETSHQEGTDFVSENKESVEVEPEVVEQAPTTTVDEVGTDQIDAPLHGAEDDLPVGWVELNDAASGDAYFFNEVENLTSWERPMAEQQEATGQPEEDNRHNEGAAEVDVDKMGSLRDGPSEATALSDSTQVALSTKEELPPGWTECFDESSGEIYYYNENDGITSWEKPSTVAAELVEALLNPTVESHLPAGWTKLVDESSGETFFFHAESNETTWTRPIPLEPQETCKNIPVTAADNNEKRIGRPQHAIATFAFGGRLCVSKSKQVIIKRTFEVAPSDVLVGVESAKQAAGILGPLNAARDDAVLSYIEERASTNPNDLLWNLILIAANSRGRLRSEEGIDKPNSPETAIVALLLRDGDIFPSNGNGNGTSVQIDRTMQKMNNGGEEESRLASVQRKLVRGERDDAVDEALASGEFAMALLVASMCGREKYQHAAQQYADKVLMPGSPLHTVAMLLTGQIGSSSSWGGNPIELCNTWRVHLAAILSNRTDGWNRVVLSLGDRLLELGETHAAHFCYMVCGCSVASPLRPDSRLTLLGCNLVPVDVTLTTSGSIQAYTYTEAYEWAKRRGNSNAAIQSLQPFKLRYAMLLADLGYKQAARRYIDTILECMGATLKDTETSGNAPGLLSLSILSADRSGLLTALGHFERRLMSRSFVDEFAATSEAVDSPTSSQEVGVDGDADVSFRTAYTNLLDISSEQPVENIGQRKTSSKQKTKARRIGTKNESTNKTLKEKSNKENALPGKPIEATVQETPPMLANIQESAPFPEKSSQENPSFMAVKPPAMMQPSVASNPILTNPVSLHQLPIAGGMLMKQPEMSPMMQQPPMTTSTPTSEREIPPKMQQPPTALSTPSKEPQRQLIGASTPEQNQSSSTKKKQVAPMSAPAAMEKGTPSSAQKRGSFFDFGIKTKMTKWLNPDATTAHAGEEMKAYFDETRKVWVFPGEDPDEVAKPVGPPPMAGTPLASTAPATPAVDLNDPLAAMMAPPARGPSARRARSGVTTPNRLGMSPPGGMPGMHGMPTAGAPPQFAVFQPAPSPASQKEEKSE